MSRWASPLDDIVWQRYWDSRVPPQARAAYRSFRGPEPVTADLGRHLSVRGLRGSVAGGLRARFRRTGVELSLAGAETDRWLAANLDNPFRDGADDDARAGAAAGEAYSAALHAIGFTRSTRSTASSTRSAGRRRGTPSRPSPHGPGCPAAWPPGGSASGPSSDRRAHRGRSVRCLTLKPVETR